MSGLTIKRAVFAAFAAVAAATMVAACSSAKGGGSSSSNPAGAGMLATHDVSGVGTVLADPSGQTLYTAEQEAGGTVKCTGPCLQFWHPVTAAGGAPSGVTGTLASTTRSDNSRRQLTYDGAPLYTFSQDGAAGDAKGNNVKDSFSGIQFTWHAVVITPAAGGGLSSSSSDSGGGGGYGGGY
jgi:predicted lipoprotein with Yx(FWY)xxD motif